MKPLKAKFAATPKMAVFAKTPHTLRLKPALVPAKPAQRDNIFSKSRDTREDRGMRAMKNSTQSQSFPHRSV